MAALNPSIVGRSHRSAPGKAMLQDVFAKTRTLLELPDSHHLALIPGSDTGAFECAMWNWLGPRGVDVLAFDSFGRSWAHDARAALSLGNLDIRTAPPGALPSIEGVCDNGRDIVFTWNGTTTGVRVPDGRFIAADRQGVSLCDATSAAFVQKLDWDRLDVTTFSWQKAMGSEAAHGMMVISDHAISALEAMPPVRGLPKVFRLLKGGRFQRDLFEASPINTPSMLAVADYQAALDWGLSVGGAAALRTRADANAALAYAWLDQSDWARPLCTVDAWRSNTAVCFTFREQFDEVRGRRIEAAMAQLLEEEEAAFDIRAYREEPPGLRLWTGATVEANNLEQVFGWLDWAYHKVRDIA